MVPSTWVCVASCERGVAVRAASSRASVNGFAWFSRPQKAVGMLIALLVGKGTANLTAVAGVGFYCFAAYCLVSNASFHPGQSSASEITASTIASLLRDVMSFR